MQVADIMNEGLTRNTAEGLRDRTMNALSHCGSLREHREEPTSRDIVVVLLLDGKTNQHGNTQYMGAIRNENSDECPPDAMAMWLFYRFQLSGETFDVQYNSFPQMDGLSQNGISANANAKATKAVFERPGIRQLSKKVTHIFRGSGARMANLFGASETDIQRGDRCDMSSMA
ncbi:hypothetical protein NliqN6_4413 [Naganishia liquefaciens]|uniref:Ndc10 domain-containing protein n=1 Tax=Naganishia liquefaciens TaxID=104408 RepID=A0A8H3TW52_9TREE|nr:hypothetical protein NliqN6_4413 [Naganishia liquefaciens]